jgi:hypothetical protein
MSQSLAFTIAHALVKPAGRTSKPMRNCLPQRDEPDKKRPVCCDRQAAVDRQEDLETDWWCGLLESADEDRILG